MPTLLKNLLAATAFAFAASALCAAPASAATHKKSVKTTHPKATSVVAAEPHEDEPDVTDSAPTEYNCELGNKVTIYHNDKDAEHIAIRWKKRLHRLTRVGTTTGAQRFENAVFGLIWIGIPSKAMLLDSKQNRQLANECKDAEQLAPAPAMAPQAPSNNNNTH